MADLKIAEKISLQNWSLENVVGKRPRAVHKQYMNKVEKKEKDDVMMKKKNIRQTDNVVKIKLLKQRLKSIYLLGEMM